MTGFFCIIIAKNLMLMYNCFKIYGRTKMIAEIIGVGTELLIGQIANTNAQYISSKLQELGIDVYYHTVVGDNPDRLKKTLKHAIERSDLVITTGGLGPTQDDLTKETIASYFNLELTMHEQSVSKIEGFFKKLGKAMTENNYKQAKMPDGCQVIPNNYGTAPGCIIESNEKMVILLPGPPVENQPMMEETIIPLLEKKTDSKLVSRYIRVFGLGESKAEEKIKDIIEKQTDPTIAPYAKTAELTFRVSTKVKKGEDPDEKLLPFIEKVKERIGKYIYSIDNESISEVAVKQLIKNNFKISLAESCTGGLISKMITDIPGASKVLDRCIVTYSNEAKVQELGIDSELISKYGAVSKQVSEAMANGIMKKTESDIAVSITGIAGPDGGTEDKPVGLVYIGIADKKGVKVYRKQLLGNRDRIRYITALYVFDLIRKKYQGK
jgi:nicotinamide-nucleotide amidase